MVPSLPCARLVHHVIPIAKGDFSVEFTKTQKFHSKFFTSFFPIIVLWQTALYALRSPELIFVDYLTSFSWKPDKFSLYRMEVLNFDRLLTQFGKKFYVLLLHVKINFAVQFLSLYQLNPEIPFNYLLLKCAVRVRSKSKISSKNRDVTCC